MRLGCIGDDFTGSGDLGNTLARAGMAATLYSGVPTAPAAPGVEAGIIALKSRTLPVEDAVAQSLDALAWLLAQGAEQIFFKYCSTFDSTDQGNIGPVAEALAAELGETATLFCPAFPTTGRQVFQGHLFVNDLLLSDTGMRDHPLTPMTDPDLRRVLARQSQGAVGHVPLSTVRAGAQAVAERMAAEAEAGRPLLVVDAIEDADLVTLGQAAAGRRLLTGGSGLAVGLPQVFGCTSGRSVWRPVPGPAVVLSGSCSEATRGQVARYRAAHPSLEITAEAVMAGDITAHSVLEVVNRHRDAAPLVFSSAAPEVVRMAQERFGRDALAARIEALFTQVAAGLPALGVTRLVSAGGETSGAVVQGLGARTLDIGPELAPGVPALRDPDSGLALTLKSGNFGGPDFFAEALLRLEEG